MYTSCKKEESNESDTVVEKHYNETLTSFNIAQFGKILNSGPDRLRIENGRLWGHPTRLSEPRTSNATDSYDDFSKQTAPEMVKTIKLCDRIAFVFEMMAKYDARSNEYERNDASYREFKCRMMGLIPVNTLKRPNGESAKCRKF